VAQPPSRRVRIPSCSFDYSRTLAAKEDGMRYRLFGRRALRGPDVALGTMTFGTDWGWGADEAECARIVAAFADAGGNFIDTASNYTDGSSERIVGELTEGDRDRGGARTKE